MDNSALSDQPQYSGRTSLGEGGLPCGSMSLSTLSKQLALDQRKGPIIGVEGAQALGFGNSGLWGFLGGPSNQPVPSFQKTQNQLISMTDPMHGGQARLARPYGPRDNLSMKGEHSGGSLLPSYPLQWNYALGQFGKGSEKRLSFRGSGRRSKRKTKRSKRFGVTPGTKAWAKSMKSNLPKTKSGIDGLSQAHLLPGEEFLLRMPGYNNVPYTGVNLPMNYNANVLNSPGVQGFGSNGGMNSSPTSLQKMAGLNLVGYEMPLPTWNAGGNTTNWATNSSYLPKGYFPGGESVAFDWITPNAWLETTPGLKSTSHNARSYTRKGLRFGSKKRKPKNKRKSKKKAKRSKRKPKNQFGLNFFRAGNPPSLNSPSDLVYTFEGGDQTVFQPLPPQFRLDKTVVKGSYATKAKFGNKKRRKRSKRKAKTNRRSKFGGKTISLDRVGKISIR